MGGAGEMGQAILVGDVMHYALRRLVFAALVVPILAPVAAADTAGEFCSEASAVSMICQMEAQLEAMGGTVKKPTCQDGKGKIATRFQALKKTAKGESLALLKDFYGAYMTNTQLAAPRSDETERDYKRRVDAASTDLLQRCNRIRVEE